MIKITDSAQKYFLKLLKTKKKGTQIRIFMKYPNTIYTKFEICFYLPKNTNENDIIIKFNYFSVYIEKILLTFIKDAKIDTITDKFGSQITIKTPNFNINQYCKTITNTIDNNNLSLKEKIENIIHTQINPQLAMHGGSVSLINITEDTMVMLKFHGGCNGCSMARYTIKEGIEKILKKIFPEIKSIIDVTQHQHSEHSFY